MRHEIRRQPRCILAWEDGGNRNSRRLRQARNEEVSNRNEGVQGGTGGGEGNGVISILPRHRCHRTARLSIHFIRNAFAITLRCPGHGLSNGAPRGSRERPRNAMCVQHKWPSANINNRRGKYTVRRDARFPRPSFSSFPPLSRTTCARAGAGAGGWGGPIGNRETTCRGTPRCNGAIIAG